MTSAPLRPGRWAQLLEEEPERQKESLGIIQRRLVELESLWEELFLYTRIQNGALPLERGEIAALPPGGAGGFYPQLEAAGVEPELRFAQEDMKLWASPEALGRVYRRLIANAPRHGGGLTVSGRDGKIRFSNVLPPGPRPDPPV